MKRLLSMLLISIMAFALSGTVSAQEYYMPSFWMLSHGQPISFKDIAGNESLFQNHDSIDFISSQLACTDDGIWYAYHMEWVYRHPIMTGPAPKGSNGIYRRISVNSVIGEQDGYIVIKKDIFDNDGYLWWPLKKISKVRWTLGDPISQWVDEHTAADANYCSKEMKTGGAIAAGQNTWVLTEELSTLENRFWDGTSKIWNGVILHIVESEPNKNRIDYWLMFGQGLIRIKISTSDGYPWLESGAP